MPSEEITQLLNDEVEMTRNDDEILFMKELKNEIEAFCYDLRDLVNGGGNLGKFNGALIMKDVKAALDDVGNRKKD